MKRLRDDRVPSADCSPRNRREAQAGQLIADTMVSLRAAFVIFNHRPSSAQWVALEAIVRTLAAMATGTCPAVAYLSSLDPGVGKTQAVVHFLKVLLASGRRHAGVLICIERREEIKIIAARACLSDGDFAVLTSDDEMNALGRGVDQRHNAPVLFTTHAMLERRLSFYKSFRAAEEFHFRGKPRAVRVWDEAFIPGKPLTVARWSISHLFDYLQHDYRPLVADLEELVERLKLAPNGSRIEIPDLAVRHGVNISQIRPALRGNSKAERIAEALWLLFGRVVTVRQDGGPEADASGAIRRGNSYQGHTVHVWLTGGSKHAWKKREGALWLAEGIASAIRERLGEEWLAIAHKDITIKGFDLAEEVCRLLPAGTRVKFITWGKHDATNAFAAVPNVILAGTLFLPPSLLEALGRCAAGVPSSAGHFAKADLDAVEIGEHHHRILQAAGRGKVRNCKGDGCPPGTHTYIIASPKSQIARTIGDVLPGATIVDWQPHAKAAPRAGKLMRKMAAALEAIVNIREDSIAAIAVMEAIDWDVTKSGRDDFKRRIRNAAGFRHALEAAGFREERRGAGRGGQVWFVRSTTPA